MIFEGCLDVNTRFRLPHDSRRANLATHPSLSLATHPSYLATPPLPSHPPLLNHPSVSHTYLYLAVHPSWKNYAKNSLFGLQATPFGSLVSKQLGTVNTFLYLRFATCIGWEMFPKKIIHWILVKPNQWHQIQAIVCDSLYGHWTIKDRYPQTLQRIGPKI
jgi:hypothetical protein